MPPKRLRESPKKGTDKCATCDENLHEDSCAMNCDGCGLWICIDCLEMSEAEYSLLTKMTRRVGCEWKCPLCKSNPQVASGASLNDIQKIMDKNLEPFRSALSAVKELDTKVKDAVKEAFAELRDQLTTDIDNRFSGVESRLATIEQCTSFDQAAVQRLVESEIRTLKNDLEVQLETKVRHMIADDRDRQRRKLNIVVFGVPPQTSDELYIKRYLASDYGLPNVSISNVRRLSNLQTQGQAATTSTGNKPVPIMFSVPDFKTKKQILQKSYERKGSDTIQFCNDVSKTDCKKRAKLYEELQARQAQGKTNLVIQGNAIVPKNVPTRAVPPAALEL